MIPKGTTLISIFQASLACTQCGSLHRYHQSSSPDCAGNCSATESWPVQPSFSPRPVTSRASAISLSKEGPRFPQGLLGPRHKDEPLEGTETLVPRPSLFTVQGRRRWFLVEGRTVNGLSVLSRVTRHKVSSVVSSVGS